MERVFPGYYGRCHSNQFWLHHRLMFYNVEHVYKNRIEHYSSDGFLSQAHGQAIGIRYRCLDGIMTQTRGWFETQRETHISRSMDVCSWYVNCTNKSYKKTATDNAIQFVAYSMNGITKPFTMDTFEFFLTQNLSWQRGDFFHLDISYIASRIPRQRLSTCWYPHSHPYISSYIYQNMKTNWLTDKSCT